MSIMQTPTSPRNTEWKPGHIPRLSYRNAAPPDQREPSSEERLDPMSSSPPLTATSSRLSISQIRQTLPQQRRASVQDNSTGAPKRKGVLGGLFSTKEPTRGALNQVAAQLIAQHGSIDPQAVPNVRQEKMPDSVPKVNSKWNGVPESAKMKEKEEKARLKAAKRRSLTFSNQPRFSSETGPAYSTTRRNSNSTAGSTGTRGSKAGSLRPSHHSSETAVDHPSLDSHSRPSSSGLPEISCYFPDDIPASPTVPTKYREGTAKLTATQDWAREGTVTDRAGGPRTLLDLGTLAEPPKTPSPLTPVEARKTNTTAAGMLPSNTDSVGLASKKKSRDVQAFLAGEAQELQVPEDAMEVKVDLPIRHQDSAIGSLRSEGSRISALKDQAIEKRPDSSRERLGLRASFVVREDVLPWEVNDRSDSNTQSSSSLNMKSKTKGGVGKSKDKW